MKVANKECRELTQNSQLVRNKKNRENTRQRKTITRTKQYLRDSAIYLRPWSCRDFIIIREKKNTKCGYSFSLTHLRRQQQPTKP